MTLLTNDQGSKTITNTYQAITLCYDTLKSTSHAFSPLILKNILSNKCCLCTHFCFFNGPVGIMTDLFIYPRSQSRYAMKLDWIWSSLSPEAIISRAWSPIARVQIHVEKKVPLLPQVRRPVCCCVRLKS